ncbi:MAG: hypothetical protein H6818_08740 [Phycisphaerales bacterium]|nr:hypothetical protein [Phycisphaerales bacterium]MCB9862657.1 hypothetical protein [Phycisphaerales bacterium]
MTPHDEIEKLLAEVPLMKPRPDDVERVRQRIAAARPTAPAFWRRPISVGFAAAACLLVGLLSATGTALMLKAGGGKPGAETTTAPDQLTPARPTRQPQFVIQTEFFSRPTGERAKSRVDITRWSTQVGRHGDQE